MTSLENRELENNALNQFVNLIECGDAMGVKVRSVMKEELTPRQAELIHMRYMEGMSMTEIAQRLGISVSTVSRTLKRGRGRIRKYLRYNGRYFTRRDE